MMRHTLFAICYLVGTLVCRAEKEVSICLTPEDEMGSRHPFHLIFKDIKWSADSPWFHKPAPVCKVVIRPMDLSKFKEEALRRGMVPTKGDWGKLGKAKDGAINYETTKRPYLGVGGNPRLRKFFYGAAPFDDFERDEHQMAVVKPLATREEAVNICREWMKRLGIDENEFYRRGDWPGGFDIDLSTPSVSRIHPVTKQKVVAPTGQQLRFIQQIGGLSTFWSGYGGNVVFSIGDGGEFCGLNGCLRAWEKIGDYEVLDRAATDAAVRDGFAWVHDPIRCETLEIVKVSLEAFHSDWDEPQTEFPLVYTLRCKLHGGQDDGQKKTIQVPALKQHRQRYGPPPELSDDEKRTLRDLRENLPSGDSLIPVLPVEPEPKPAASGKTGI